MSLETINFSSPLFKNLSLTSLMTFSYAFLSPITKEVILVSTQTRNYILRSIIELENFDV
jgi:hypothetical protein